jgi:2-polyprenyl-3-methyl-5-hydroxy-6-metoxy-1,4-benzoquinol methylase
MYVPGLGRPGRSPEERLADAHHLNQGGWRYTDREVAGLPFIEKEHSHFKEWKRRQASCRRLIRYLADKKKAAGILEVGCGNGWLSHQLSTVPGSRVVGLDLNFIELRQAARVFHGKPNLKFIYGDFYSDVLQDLSYDIIVLAAVIPHFPSLTSVLEKALPHLRPRGEIHILDSCLYEPDLAPFHYQYRYDPRSFWNRLRGRGGDFPWISVTP